MPVDTIITGGTVVTPTSTLEAAIAISDGKIVGVNNAELLPDANQVIDATDQLVMPGMVDPHVHIDDHVSIDSYETATRAAALGGITTVIDFAWQAYVGEESPWQEEGTLAEGISQKREKQEEALIDFSLHGGILREGEDLFEEIEEVVETGVTSFKMYTAYEFGLSNGFIHRVFDEISDLGAVGLVHTEDDSVCNTLTKELQEKGKEESEYYPKSRPDYTEAMAADDAVSIAKEIGAQYYGVHTTNRKAAEVIDRYQNDRSQIRGETCTHYTVLDESVYKEQGNLPKIAPPIRSTDDNEAMFEYLQNGTLNVVSSDHVAAKRDSKEEVPWWEGPFGANGLQRSLSVFHDEAVIKRDLSYPFLVRVMSTNPARTFGLANKGTLEPGTDADIILFNPDESYKIRADQNASKADYSIYEGKEVTGKVTKTLVRGEIVADGKESVIEPGHGTFIERELPDWKT